MRLGEPVVDRLVVDEPVVDEHCRGTGRGAGAAIGRAGCDQRTRLTCSGSAVTVHTYPLDAAGQALRDLEAGPFDGAAVLIPLRFLAVGRQCPAHLLQGALRPIARLRTPGILGNTRSCHE